MTYTPTIVANDASYNHPNSSEAVATNAKKKQAQHARGIHMIMTNHLSPLVGCLWRYQNCFRTEIIVSFLNMGHSPGRVQDLVRDLPYRDEFRLTRLDAHVKFCGANVLRFSGANIPQNFTCTSSIPLSPIQ